MEHEIHGAYLQFAVISLKAALSKEKTQYIVQLLIAQQDNEIRRQEITKEAKLHIIIKNLN